MSPDFDRQLSRAAVFLLLAHVHVVYRKSCFAPSPQYGVTLSMWTNSFIFGVKYENFLTLHSCVILMSGWIWTTVCAVSHCLVLFLSWSVGFLNIDIDSGKHTIFGEGIYWHFFLDESGLQATQFYVEATSILIFHNNVFQSKKALVD